MSRKAPLSAENKFYRIAHVFVQGGRPSAMKALGESQANSVVAAPLVVAAAGTAADFFCFCRWGQRQLQGRKRIHALPEPRDRELNRRWRRRRALSLARLENAKG